MLYWECRRRLASLRQFRLLAFDYFHNIQRVPRRIARQPIMNDKSQKARHAMNQMMEDVVLSFDLLGIVHYVRYTPPPMIGGYIQNVDVLANVFDLSGFEIPAQTVFDCTDRAIGAYEANCQKLRRQSFNPLYWLGLLIVWVLHLPFKLLGAAGFDAHKAENSLLGKLSKLALGIVTFAAAVIEVADHWTLVRSFIHACIVALHRL